MRCTEPHRRHAAWGAFAADAALSGRRAFTLLEMLVTLTIIAVAASLVLPMLNDDRQARLLAASSILISDIEMAQVMNISYPEEPVVVRCDTANNRYWLAYAYDPDFPITRIENGEPYLVQFGVGRAFAAAGVTMKLDQLDDATLQFNPQGGLVDFTVTPSIVLSCNGQTVTLRIAPTTGTVTEIDGDATTP